MLAAGSFMEGIMKDAVLELYFKSKIGVLRDRGEEISHYRHREESAQMHGHRRNSA